MKTTRAGREILAGWQGGDTEMCKQEAHGAILRHNLEEAFEDDYYSPNGNVTVEMHPERLHFTQDRKLLNPLLGQLAVGGESKTSLVFEVCYMVLFF